MNKIVLILLILISCKEEPATPLALALRSEHPAIQKVIENLEEHEVQIIYTQIDTNAQGTATFKDYSFQLDNSQYFYPASTIKLPVAILALESIDATKGVSIQSKYTIAGDTVAHTIENDLRQIFAISDNEAFNRLYELIGRDAINETLGARELQPIRISHRLSIPDPANSQRDSLLFNNRTLGGGEDSRIQKLQVQKIKKGIGYIRNDSLISEAMDFSEKNYFPLATQHNLMKRLFFEQNYSEAERFHLSEISKKLLKEAMHTVPRKAGYDEAEFYDSYGKFFIYGNTKGRIQDHIKIFNKVGYAYGTLTETALITDEKENVCFLLSATILVNKNNIFNDDVYEYGTVGVPFLTELGRELYKIELDRKKN